MSEIENVTYFVALSSAYKEIISRYFNKATISNKELEFGWRELGFNVKILLDCIGI